MEEFKKVTEKEFYEKELYNGLLANHVSKKVFGEFYGSSKDYDIALQEAIIDCESPIEQLLAISFSRILYEGVSLNIANPYVDILAIEKQKEIICASGNKYRCDFYIPVCYTFGSNKEVVGYIVECDGYEFHQKTKEQVERDNIRQRELQANGYEVIRFSGTEIYHKSYKCALECLKIIYSKYWNKREEK